MTCEQKEQLVVIAKMIADSILSGVKHDADGKGGDFFPAPSDEALEWARNFTAAMEAK